MSEKRAVDNLKKVPLKKEEPSKTQKGSQQKTANPRLKLWYFFGGGCCLILLSFVIFSGFFSYSLFRSRGDSVIPTPNSSISTSIVTAKPTSKPTVQTSSQGRDYPEPQACEHLELVSSVPLSISTSEPGLKQDTDTHYYQVYGFTPNEVRGQLNECGAKSGGEGYDAYTSYYTNWNYKLQPVSAGCQVQNVAVGIQVDFFYPKWDDPGNAQAGLAEHWQTYMTNLIIHEEGHKDIAVQGAQKILDELSSLPTYGTCDEASSQASSLANSTFREYDNRNKAYDDETGHGATQGAYFP